MAVDPRLRISRQFEVFLFGGVPELPEQMYERDYHSKTSIRETGLSQLRHSRDSFPGTVIGRIVINLETGVTKFSEQSDLDGLE